MSMSLEWPVNPFGRSAPVVPSGDRQEGALSASDRSRWRQDALQAQPQILQRTAGWDGCGPLPFRRLAMYYLERPGPCWICFLQTKGQRVQTQLSQKTLWTTTSFVSRKCMERTSFFQPSRCWLRDFDSLVQFILIVNMREDRLSASTGILFLKTHLWHMWLLVTVVMILWTVNLGDTT